MTPAYQLAAGIHGIVGVAEGFAATQAAWRFFSNPRADLPSLAQPLLEHARQTVPLACGSHVLILMDWSWLDYNTHEGKSRRTDCGGGKGYNLLSVLAVGDKSGQPIAPVCLELEDAQGIYSTRDKSQLPLCSPLDSLGPVMQHVADAHLGRTPVFIIDREADSVGHFREWAAAGRQFLVRANDRLVDHEGQDLKLSAVAEALLQQDRFVKNRDILLDGKEAVQHVAEAQVVIKTASQKTRKIKGKLISTKTPGPALALRLVVSRIVDMSGKELSRWMLLTNLPESVDAGKVAIWYYWRWRIESSFKLMKQAGLELEQWQQESGRSIIARLTVASMACALAWNLARSDHPGADEIRRLLVSLTGRQMKWDKGKGRRTFTEPALLAGLMILIPVLHALEKYDPKQLLQMIQQVIPGFELPIRKDV